MNGMIDLSHLKYKELDGIMETLQFVRSGADFDIEKLRFVICCEMVQREIRKK